MGELLTPWIGAEVQQIIPRATANPNTYSGMFGFGKFPFHTDLAHRRDPPRYLMLRCIKGYLDVNTNLLDSRCLFGEELLGTLDRSVVKPRRPQNSRWPLLRLSEKLEGARRLRWDSKYLIPANKVAVRGFQGVADLLEKTECTQISLANVGDTLLIDNWRILHGRSVIKPGREDRHIERVYLGELR